MLKIIICIKYINTKERIFTSKTILYNECMMPTCAVPTRKKYTKDIKELSSQDVMDEHEEFSE